MTSLISIDIDATKAYLATRYDNHTPQLQQHFECQFRMGYAEPHIAALDLHDLQTNLSINPVEVSSFAWGMGAMAKAVNEFLGDIIRTDLAHKTNLIKDISDCVIALKNNTRFDFNIIAAETKISYDVLDAWCTLPGGQVNGAYKQKVGLFLGLFRA